MRSSTLFCLLFISINLFGQTWFLEYPSNWNYHWISQLNKDYDSGYLLNFVVANASNNQHQLLYKIDENGENIYEKLIGVPFVESTTYNIPCNTSAGDIFLPGSLWGADLDENPSLIKLDECRNKIWCTSLNNNPDYPDFFWDAVVDEYGNIFALSLQNDIDIVNYSIHIHKFSPNGNQIWRKSVLNMEVHPLFQDPDPYDLDILPDGSLILTGFCYYPDPGPTLYSFIRMFIAKFDNNAEEEWLYVHGINDYEYSLSFNSVKRNNFLYADGAYYVAGSEMVPYIFKLNLEGDLIHSQQLNIPPVGDYNSEGPFLISEALNDDFFGATLMYRTNQENGMPAFVQFDTTGNLIDFFMPEEQYELRDCVAPVVSNNKIIIAGNSEGVSPSNYDIFALRLRLDNLRFDSISDSNYIYDSLCNHTIGNSTVALDSCRIIVSNDNYNPPSEHSLLNLFPYPTPVNNELTISIENSLLFRNIEVKMYNQSGIVIHETKINSGVSSLKADVSSWPAGLYLAVAFSNSTIVGNCKFIITR